MTAAAGQGSISGHAAVWHLTCDDRILGGRRCAFLVPWFAPQRPRSSWRAMLLSRTTDVELAVAGADALVVSRDETQRRELDSRGHRERRVKKERAGRGPFVRPERMRGYRRASHTGIQSPRLAFACFPSSSCVSAPREPVHLSLLLSLSLAHTQTHTHTHARARKLEVLVLTAVRERVCASGVVSSV